MITQSQKDVVQKLDYTTLRQVWLLMKKSVQSYEYFDYIYQVMFEKYKIYLTNK